MAIRFDSVKIKGKVSRTDEGYIRGDAIITRAGVFRYLNKDGSARYELRHPTDVFDVASLETLKMRPITNEHPWFGAVKSDNVRRVQVGMTGETITSEEPFVMSSVLVTDASAIKEIDAGKQELSAGYKCDTIAEKGIFDGIPYDYRQKNIRYNHVALCDVGRAGPAARLNLDSVDSDTDICFQDDNSLLTRRPNMGKIVLDSCEYEAPQEVINAMTKLKTDTATLNTQVEEKSKELSSVTADRDTIKSRLDSFEKRDFAKETADAVKARRSLETAASTALDKLVVDKFDSMSDADIKAAVIAKSFPEIKLDGKDSAYIEGCFNAAIAHSDLIKKTAAAAANRATSAGTEKNDSGDDTKIGSGSAHERYKARIANAYKGSK